MQLCRVDAPTRRGDLVRRAVKERSQSLAHVGVGVGSHQFAPFSLIFSAMATQARSHGVPRSQRCSKAIVAASSNDACLLIKYARARIRISRITACSAARSFSLKYH